MKVRWILINSENNDLILKGEIFEYDLEGMIKKIADEILEEAINGTSEIKNPIGILNGKEEL